MTWAIHNGDVLAQLAKLPDESVQTCVTSPPYWGLRDYGVPKSVWGGDVGCEHQWGDSILQNATNHTDKRRWNHTRNGRDEEQPIEKRVAWLRTQVDQGNICQLCGAWRGALGLEPTPEMFVEHIVTVFREVRRVLRPDGTLWLNMGDSYATGAGKVGDCPGGGKQGENWKGRGVHTSSNSGKSAPRIASMGPMTQPNRMPLPGLKPKDLCGIPWMVAFALRADGWWLRQDIIWSKPNPMPESVTDRCTKAHEYLFLLSKSARYYFDQDAIREPLKDASIARLIQDVESQQGSDRVPGKTNGNMKAVRFGGTKYGDDESEQTRTKSGKEWTPKQAGSGGINDNRSGYFDKDTGGPLCGSAANKKSVWTVTTQPFSEAHFATFPPKLVEPCILAGSREGDTVLDPFSGAGTTGLVALRLGRNYIGIELNPEYVDMSKRRIEQDAPLFNASVPNKLVIPEPPR